MDSCIGKHMSVHLCDHDLSKGSTWAGRKVNLVNLAVHARYIHAVAVTGEAPVEGGGDSVHTSPAACMLGACYLCSN